MLRNNGPSSMVWRAQSVLFWCLLIANTCWLFFYSVKVISRCFSVRNSENVFFRLIVICLIFLTYSNDTRFSAVFYWSTQSFWVVFWSGFDVMGTFELSRISRPWRIYLCFFSRRTWRDALWFCEWFVVKYDLPVWR